VTTHPTTSIEPSCLSTPALPNTAVIQSAVLKIKQNGTPVGSKPFNALVNLWVDIRNGPFGSIAALQLGDFSAAASATKVSVFNKTPVSGRYTNTLNATGRSNINKAGVTQFRLYFIKDDNNNLAVDFMKFVSGNVPTISFRPALIVTYYIP
jgi:hypothetical protein